SIIAPLRHPVLRAHQLAPLALLSEGRRVVHPPVSWHRAEYEALGVAFESRGELLDEHLEAWRVLWRDTPASFQGRHFAVRGGSLEPQPVPPAGGTDPARAGDGGRNARPLPRRGERRRPRRGARADPHAARPRVHDELHQALTVPRRTGAIRFLVPGRVSPHGRARQVTSKARARPWPGPRPRPARRRTRPPPRRASRAAAAPPCRSPSPSAAPRGRSHSLSRRRPRRGVRPSRGTGSRRRRARGTPGAAAPPRR